jgi:hypothetical protein
MLHQLFMTTTGALFGRCSQENLQGRIWKNHSPHVPAIGDQTGRPAIGSLTRQQRIPNGRLSRYPRCCGARGFGSHLGRYLAPLEKNLLASSTIPAEHAIQPMGKSGKRLSRIQINPLFFRRYGDQAVQRTAIKKMPPQTLSQHATDRPFSGTARAVETDDGCR